MTEKLWVFGCIALICVAFSITIFAVSTVSAPIGADVYFHFKIADLIAQGNIGGAWQFPLTENFFPYGMLLFHFGMSLISLSGSPYYFALVLEAILMPLTFTLTVWLMIKKVNIKAAFITGLCLLGTIAFIDGTIQLRPESLDLLLYPLMLFAVLSANKKSFIGMALITIYSHGLASLANIYGIALKLLREQKWRKTIIAGLIGTTPIILLSLYYIEGAFQKWFTLAGANNSNPQQTMFWVNPLFFIPFYSGVTLFGFVFMFKRHKSYFESLLCWGILASAIMIPFWADRWLQYITIPLSCLVGLGLKDTGWKKLIVILPILTMISFMYVAYWWFISASHQWWYPGA
jgi:hypothetical protein